MNALGEYIAWSEPLLQTDYYGPIKRWPMGRSIFSPTARDTHSMYGQETPLPLGEVTTEIGGAALRIGGAALGGWVGSMRGTPFMLLGIVAGYGIGALMARIGGEG